MSGDTEHTAKQMIRSGKTTVEICNATGLSRAVVEAMRRDLDEGRCS
jgi:DNA-binding CsgD family transcriptional regulator